MASNGKVYCWGFNKYGQLGNGKKAVDQFYDGSYDSNVPIEVKTDGALAGKTIKQISSGGNHTCVIASDNKGYCWGSNEGF